MLTNAKQTREDIAAAPQNIFATARSAAGTIPTVTFYVQSAVKEITSHNLIFEIDRARASPTLASKTWRAPFSDQMPFGLLYYPVLKQAIFVASRKPCTGWQDK